LTPEIPEGPIIPLKSSTVGLLAHVEVPAVWATGGQ
jgi:hypothetical protein